jgi:hypothetical protein
MSETIVYRDRPIEIIQDECPLNPRKEYDNLGTMVCFHRLYTLGDEQPNCDQKEAFIDLLREHDPWLDEAEDRLEAAETYLSVYHAGSGTTYRHATLLDNARKLVVKRREHVRENVLCILPLYLYDHSAITMNTSGFSCGWDSGQVGFIYCSLKDAQHAWSLPDEAGWDYVVYPEGGLPNWLQDGSPVIGKSLRELTELQLEGEVKTYDHYLTGGVYGWDAGGDSCWGYYGYDHKESGLLEAAQAAIDCEIEREKKEEAERLRAYHHQVLAWIRHGVPLGYRYNYAK